MRNLLLVTACVFVLAACAEKKDSQSPPATNNGSQTDGTDTGGGGFADQSAIDALNLAKHALAQRIENIPDEAFEEYRKDSFFQYGLPEGKRKAWLVKIIRGLEVKRGFEERYQKPLKFNYDPKTEQIYATSYFTQTFGYGRFQSAHPKDRVRLMHEIFLDILHEVSHLYGVGVSKELDYQSDNWAKDFLNSGLDSFYVCEDSWNNYLIRIDKSTGLVSAYYNPTAEQKKNEHRASTFERQEYWRFNTDALMYQKYEYLDENYATEIFNQYVALAKMGGKDQIPDYFLEGIYPFEEGFLFSDKFKNPYEQKLAFGINYRGSIGYPTLKSSERKYILFRRMMKSKDLIEINLDTLEATYSVGYRESDEGEFTYSPLKTLKFSCKDYRKPIVLSIPRDVGRPYWWAPYTEE